MAKNSKIYFGTEMLESACVVCGSRFFQKNSDRTRDYCSDYNKFLNALSRTIDKIKFTDSSHLKRIKSDLFSIVNHLPRDIK